MSHLRLVAFYISGAAVLLIEDIRSLKYIDFQLHSALFMYSSSNLGFEPGTSIEIINQIGCNLDLWFLRVYLTFFIVCLLRLS